MAQRRIALLLSYIFQPLVYAIVMVAIVTEVDDVHRLGYILASFIGITIVVSYVIIQVFVRRKIDYEFTDVATRPALLAVCMSSLLLTYLITVTSPVLVAGAFLYRNLLIAIGISLIVSTKWKISLHALFASSTTFLALAYNYYQLAIFLAVILPILGWSRVYLHKHTPMQYLCGSILGIIMLWV